MIQCPILGNTSIYGNRHEDSQKLLDPGVSLSPFHFVSVCLKLSFEGHVSVWFVSVECVLCPCSESPHDSESLPMGDLIFVTGKDLLWESSCSLCSAFCLPVNRQEDHHGEKSKYSLKNNLSMCWILLTQLLSDC